MGILKKKNKINRSRPTIGITGPDKGGGAAWLFTALGVLLAGGLPIRITPDNPRTSDGLQALIIGGGADVDPGTYETDHVLQEYLQSTLKQPNINLFQRIGRLLSWVYYPLLFFLRKMLSQKLSFGLDQRRDRLELQLLDQATRKDLPVLGICRGAQLLNVYFGGTLYRDIASFYTEEPNPASIFPVKTVCFEQGSKLHQLLRVEQLRVNALHNQAVKQPGKRIKISATETNGVVQAIEHTSQTFMVGVQWHPEYLPQSAENRKLFQELVNQACRVQQQIEDTDLAEAMQTPVTPALHELEQQVSGI